jgi:hypothetical protein
VSGTRIGNLANIDLASTWEENTAHNGSVPASSILALCYQFTETCRRSIQICVGFATGPAQVTEAYW